MTTTGTKQWCSSNVNFCFGCTHDCKYCYAKGMAKRFRPDVYENWNIMILNMNAITKQYRKRKGRIMFPSSHDLTPEIRIPTLIILDKLLRAGNEVLITTKPHFEVIKEICLLFGEYRNQIQFRFTLSSCSLNRSLEIEPGAPTPNTRLNALKLAYEYDYRTSVSIEPWLDPTELIPDWIKMIQDHVTESIWLGIMNRKFCPVGLWDDSKWGKIAVKELVNNIRSDTEIDQWLIRWKDSVVNLLRDCDISLKYRF